MYNWNAKVHKSGTKVAVFNGTKLIKVVESSKETFEPAEAQKFAEELVKTLQKSSAQMESPSAAPSTVTEAELQSKSMDVATQQATGKGADNNTKTDDVGAEVSVAIIEEENEEDKLASTNEDLKKIVASLKKKLVQERNERIVERKARRGLAVAKQLVIEGKLEDSYEAIKNKVAEIVKLEDSEIDRIERKIAGEQEFDSIDEAQKELRRQARIARINRQAAAEAQEDLDEEQADALDKKADEAEAKIAHIENVIEEMSKVAEETEKVEEAVEEKADETKTDTPEEVVEEKADAEKVVTEEKADETKTDTPVEVTKTESKTDVSTVPETAVATENSTEKLADLARKYRAIAANHRKLAEAAESEGDIETADKQDAMGDEAEEKAEDIEKKLAECGTTEKEEKADEVAPAPETETAETEKKEASKRDPGKVVTSSEHVPLKREDGELIESFGIDKNASLVEENDYSNDPEVEMLSKMWHGVEKDD